MSDDTPTLESLPLDVLARILSTHTVADRVASKQCAASSPMRPPHRRHCASPPSAAGRAVRIALFPAGSLRGPEGNAEKAWMAFERPSDWRRRPRGDLEYIALRQPVVVARHRALEGQYIFKPAAASLLDGKRGPPRAPPQGVCAHGVPPPRQVVRLWRAAFEHPLQSSRDVRSKQDAAKVGRSATTDAATPSKAAHGGGRLEVTNAYRRRRLPWRRRREVYWADHHLLDLSQTSSPASASGGSSAAANDPPARWSAGPRPARGWACMAHTCVVVNGCGMGRIAPGTPEAAALDAGNFDDAIGVNLDVEEVNALGAGQAHFPLGVQADAAAPFWEAMGQELPPPGVGPRAAASTGARRE